MMAFYGYADSAYPLLPNQTPFVQYRHPGSEAVPLYVKGDVPRPVRGYDPWPFHGNSMMGYSGPCHSCFNHGSFPGYYGGCQSGCVHPSLPRFHCSGYRTPDPGAGNVQYVVPPPHCMMQQPRCGEYEKWVPGEYHCCGCPNHVHSQRSDRGLKVEEEPVPDGGKKESKSLVPSRSDGHQYPVFWIPNGQANDRQQPVVWIPNGNVERQFPFPIVWFPAKDMETKADGQGQSNDKSEQQPTSVPEFLPVKLPEESKGSKESQKLKDNSESEMKQNTSSRSIEVKQLDAPKEGSFDSNICVKGNATEATSKKRSSSPVKSSKLPPVCLRVEPLPKKKNGNGASRSPSPPKSKSSSPGFQLDTNLNQDSQGRKEVISGMEEVQEKNNIMKVMVDAQKAYDQVGETNTISQPQVPVKSALNTPEVSESNGEGGETSSAEAGDSCAIEGTEPEGTMEEIKATYGDNQAQKTIITDEQAALLIQSVYRGYNVRRWKPLEKLRQIAQVREQLTDIRSRIDTLDSSDLQKDDKQTVVIGEMIMSLLLKLDTVQGLHPSFRDMRKSLARELVALQERLDTIKVENEISRAKRDTSSILGSGEVRAVNEQEHVQEEGNKEMVVAQDAENRDLSFPADDVKESKLCIESSGGQRIVGLQDSEHENNHATEIKQKEMFNLEATGPHEKRNSMEMEATTDVCSEETHLPLANCIKGKFYEHPLAADEDDQALTSSLPHGRKMEEDSPENATPTCALGCLTSKEEIREEPSPLKLLPGLFSAMEDNIVENPEQQECEILHDNDVEHGVAIDAASSDIFDMNKEDPAYTMPKSDSADGSENFLDGEPKYVYESLAFFKSEEAPTFNLKEQPEKETKDIHTVDEGKGQVEDEAENRSGNFDAATFEEAEQQSELLEAVNGRLYFEALQMEEMSLTCPELQDLQSLDESCNGEGSYDRDVKVNPAPEQKNIDVTHGEEELLTREDGNVTEGRAEEVKASEETQEAEQDAMESMISNSDSYSSLGGQASPNLSPASSSVTNHPVTDDERLAEENAKLRDMMATLIEAGREQLTAISNLTGRVSDLEQKLSRKKRMRARRCRAARSPLSSSRTSMDSNKGASNVVM